MKNFKRYDQVLLICDDLAYTNKGVFKGDVGCVMDEQLVDGQIKVDFSGVDDDDNYFGACIYVNVLDLELI